jgi:hypothetical protein
MHSESLILSFQSLVLLKYIHHCSMAAEFNIKFLIIWLLLFNHLHWLYPFFLPEIFSDVALISSIMKQGIFYGASEFCLCFDYVS